ncbi:MAG: C39 family peptidase [Lachnospiraceae bacterium]|nr:C39 family peptidase [Lachnospiraceae bacterium]
MLAVISSFFLAIYFRDEILNGKSDKDRQVIENLTAEVSGTGNQKLNEILANKEQYPTELLELLSKNPETLEFVYNYPNNKNKEFDIDISEDVKSGKVPLYLQWDERWGYSSYGDSMIAINGCGPTCLSMVASYILKNDKMNPKWMAQFSEENGYVSENGTLWALMNQGAKKLGIESIEIPLDENRIRNNLEVGNPIICSMAPGDFTTEGHFIVMTGIKDGKIVVNDPNSRERSEKLWKINDIQHQTKNLWVFRQRNVKNSPTYENLLYLSCVGIFFTYRTLISKVDCSCSN